jgi:tRNA pseudouridine13 synthase
MSCWRRARLEPPVRATLKAEPGDFTVDERIAFEPAGVGEHCLVRLEKCGRTTPEVAALLARTHGIAELDVGYAGLKDKWAVARQWFSLRGVAGLAPSITEVPGLRVLEETRHTHKLRRGETAANRFRIVLRDVSDSDPGQALDCLGREGAPNYFGAQRFGRDNVRKAEDWLAHRRSRSRRHTSRFTRGLYLSVLRSYLFNKVLDERVARSSWDTAIAGDVLEGGHPSGPLWGRGRSPARAEAAEVEHAALKGCEAVCEGLEHAGLQQDRRTLVLRAQDLGWTMAGQALTLEFSLPAGGYATSFLSEVFDLQEPAHGGQHTHE